MGETSFKDHFSTRSGDYAASRPDYPPELALFLAENASARQVALDCGCGTGQLARLLAGHFEQVIATDASAQQLAAALPHPKVAFRKASAESSGLDAASVDLIVAAQAAHWFDIEAFYAEARRIARPGALLALVTYGLFHVEGEADPLLQDFYWRTAGPYWPPERRHVEDGYRSLPFPVPEIAVPDLVIQRSWTRQDLLAYMDSWSAMRALEKAGRRGALDEFADDLAQLWPDEKRQLVTWPLSVRAGYL